MESKVEGRMGCGYFADSGLYGYGLQTIWGTIADPIEVKFETYLEAQKAMENYKDENKGR